MIPDRLHVPAATETISPGAAPAMAEAMVLELQGTSIVAADSEAAVQNKIARDRFIVPNNPNAKDSSGPTKILLRLAVAKQGR